MLDIKEDTQLILTESMVLRAIPEMDRYYAFNTETGDQFQLNETAYWVLDSIKKEKGFQSLAISFRQQFQLEEAKSKRDLREVLRFALDNNMIKEAEK